MSQTQTRVPERARCSAIARPMPLVPPVTTAVLLDKSYATVMQFSKN